MPKIGCSECGEMRTVRWKALWEAYEKTGTAPPCGECRPDWRRGRPQTTGTGTKQIPCSKCGKVRWVPRRDAKKPCRKCKPRKRKPAKRSLPVLKKYGPADWKITYPCCGHKLITNTKTNLETCPQCGKKHRKVVKAEK